MDFKTGDKVIHVVRNDYANEYGTKSHISEFPAKVKRKAGKSWLIELVSPSGKSVEKYAKPESLRFA